MEAKEYELKSGGRTRCENKDCRRIIKYGEKYSVIEFKGTITRLCKQCAS